MDKFFPPGDDTRLPMEITVDVAKTTNMFSCDSVYTTTDTIFVVPTLTTHDTIQVLTAVASNNA